MMLIGGGAAAVLSFAVFAYLTSENAHSIKPGNSLTIRQFVSNGSQGAYSISFPFFEGQPQLRIADVANRTIVEKAIEPPIATDIFMATESGYYTLTLTNPSQAAALDAVILFGDQESYATLLQMVFSLLLYGGIVTAIAGAVITILDRLRIRKMKRFGDTSDLV